MKINLGKITHGASLVAQTVKNLPAVQETWVQPLGREDFKHSEARPKKKKKKCPVYLVASE